MSKIDWKKIIHDKLGLTNIKVLDAYRVGVRNAQHQQPRPVIAKLSSVRDKVACFRTSKNLKNTNIYISDDISKATADIRHQKMDALKEKRNQGYIAYFRGTDIITRRRASSNTVDSGPNHAASNLHASPRSTVQTNVPRTTEPATAEHGTAEPSAAETSTAQTSAAETSTAVTPAGTLDALPGVTVQSDATGTAETNRTLRSMTRN